MRNKFEESENVILFKVNEYGFTLEKYLKEKHNISSRLIRKLIKEEGIYLNHKKVNKKLEVKKGDIIHLLFSNEEDNNLPDTEVKLDIIYEDFDILALNKDPFRVVHTTQKHTMGTISNGVAYYFLEENIKKSVRLINRLDRDTSGVLLVGKNSFAHQQISDQFSDDSVEKWYIAVVDGIMCNDNGIIEAPIGLEDGENAIRRIVREDGKYSKSIYQVIKRYPKSTLVKVKLETGRTHQIRVHLKHIGHPIIGDSLYNKESEFINRQSLHSFITVIEQPRYKNKIKLIAKFPKDIIELIKILKKEILR